MNESLQIIKQIIGKLEPIKYVEGILEHRNLKFTVKYYVYLGELWIIRNQFSKFLSGETGNLPCRYRLADLKIKPITEEKLNLNELIDVISCKSDIELAEVLEEIKKHVVEHI